MVLYVSVPGRFYIQTYEQYIVEEVKLFSGHELQLAVGNIKNGRAPGIDGVPPAAKLVVCRVFDF